MGVPVLLLPGTLCDRLVWEEVAARLPARTILHGSMLGARSAASLAAGLLARAPPRFALAGFSLGGIVALEMIAQAPERVDRLALVDTTPLPDPAANAAERRDAADRAAEIGLARHIAEDFWPLYVAAGRAGDASLLARVTAMAEACGIDAYSDQCEVAIDRADSRPRLGGIGVPTLVLCGAEDRLCPPAIHREMACAIPGAALAVIGDAGHFALMEKPEAVAAHMRIWLEDNHPERTGKAQLA